MVLNVFFFVLILLVVALDFPSWWSNVLDIPAMDVDRTDVSLTNLLVWGMWFGWYIRSGSFDWERVRGTCSWLRILFTLHLSFSVAEWDGLGFFTFISFKGTFIFALPVLSFVELSSNSNRTFPICKIESFSMLSMIMFRGWSPQDLDEYLLRPLFIIHVLLSEVSFGVVIRYWVHFLDFIWISCCCCWIILCSLNSQKLTYLWLNNKRIMQEYKLNH